MRHADVRPNSVVRGLVMHLDIIRGPVVLCLEVEREVLLGGHVHLQGDGIIRTSFFGRDGHRIRGNAVRDQRDACAGGGAQRARYPHWKWTM